MKLLSDEIKFCPRCAAGKFNVYGDKSYQCEGCGFQWYVNMSAAVAAIIKNENNEILFTRRAFDPARGTYDLPGGFIDLGETAEQAIIREIREELNLEVTESRYWKSFPNKYCFKGMEYNTLDMVFFCSVKEFTGLEANDDVADYLFVNINDMKSEMIGLLSIRNVVECLKAEINIRSSH